MSQQEGNFAAQITEGSAAPNNKPAMSAVYDSSGSDFPDSMLSRKFGREVVNYFAGSPLNRVSFLRSSNAFLRSALPASKILLLQDLAPLSATPSHISFVPYSTVKPLIGSPYEEDSEAAFIAAYDSRKEVVPLVFLGLDESIDGVFEFTAQGGGWYRGEPYFAVDVTSVGKVEGPLGEKCRKLVEEMAAEGREFRKIGLDLGLVPSEAAILAQARSLIDWNSRNQFCAACGSRTLSINAGTKRTCPPTDKALQVERPPCISRKGIHNIAFPRTDPTVIMAILNAKGDKVLLGRQKRWPKDFYSCLAGFCEPAESLEETVRRETWEESGVRVGRVVIHSTQPWPYPANLMIGAIGEALNRDGENIHLGHDPELEDAKWVDVDEVRDALGKKEHGGLSETPPEGHREGSLRLPPPTAIAHQLLVAISGGFHLSKI